MCEPLHLRNSDQAEALQRAQGQSRWWSERGANHTVSMSKPTAKEQSEQRGQDGKYVRGLTSGGDIESVFSDLLQERVRQMIYPRGIRM